MHHDLSGGEVVVVVEERDEGQQRQDHEDKGCYFEARQLFLYVKSDETDYRQHQ
jgi:hypothetical protein